MSKKIFSLIAFACSSLLADAAPPSLAEATHVEILSSQSPESLFLSTKQSLSSLVQANAKVMDQYHAFEAALQKAIKEGKLSSQDVEFILSGLLFAAEKHQMQTRKNADKTPYIEHPLGVAESILSVGRVYDAKILVAALLHDTIEDTKTSYEEISQRFGETVSNYVKEVSESHTLSEKVRKRLQIIHAFQHSQGASIIKLSDKLYNLNNLLKEPPADWKRDRIDRYFQWAQAVIENLPNANAHLKEKAHEVIAAYWKQQQE